MTIFLKPSSAFRSTFEKQFNAATGEEEGGDISFVDFIDIVLDGPIEYAQFLEENHITGEERYTFIIVYVNSSIYFIRYA